MNIVVYMLEFQIFWDWFFLYFNCIFCVGMLMVILCDDDDLYWQFFVEDEVFYVQVICGKWFIGEIMIEVEFVFYVQVQESDCQGEWIFEFIVENQNECYFVYFFVMMYGFDDDDEFQGWVVVY